MTSQPEPVPPPVPSADHLPPGLSPNGHPTPTAQMIQQLPQMLFQAVGAALQQVPVTVQQPVTVRQFPCATCFLERLKWGKLNEAALARADEAFRAALEEMQQRPEEDRVQVNGIDFLPERIRPGAPGGPPDINDPAVMVGGTLYCASHMPGSPGQPGSGGIIPVTGFVSPSMLAGLRGCAA